MTHDVTVALAALGVLGQVAGGVLLLAGLLWLVGLHQPLGALHGAISGYELWLAFVVERPVRTAFALAFALMLLAPGTPAFP